MKNSLRTSGVLLVLWSLLRIQICRGQALIGSSHPIVSSVGDDVILPCLFRSPRDAEALILEWTRPDLQPRFVFVWRSFEELKDVKNPQFDDRAFLFQDEVKKGNISLKLTNVNPKDSGVYRCFIPTLGEETSVRLIVGSSSPVLVSVALVDVWGPRVVLQCGSGGWFPEPELWWLDSEGALLSVEHSVSESDGLYEVSSRVTVEQSGTFSCTVNQSSTNLSERSSVQLEDVFGVGISPVITGFTVGLVVFAGVAIILSILFCVTKQNLNRLQDSQIKPLEQENKRIKAEMDSLIKSLEQKNKTLENKLVQEINSQRKLSEETRAVIIDHFDGRSVRLKKSSYRKGMKDWSLRIEVDEAEALIYKFEDFTLDQNKTQVTIWAQGYCPPEADKDCNMEWKDQAPWDTGEVTIVSLYDKEPKLIDRRCEHMIQPASTADCP